MPNSIYAIEGFISRGSGLGIARPFRLPTNHLMSFVMHPGFGIVLQLHCILGRLPMTDSTIYFVNVYRGLWNGDALVESLDDQFTK